MVAELEDDKGRIKKLHEHRGGGLIPSPVIEHHLNTAQRLLEAAAPQAVCPECGGADPRRAACRTCDGAGFVGGGDSRSSPRCCKRRPRRSDADLSCAGLSPQVDLNSVAEFDVSDFCRADVGLESLTYVGLSSPTFIGSALRGPPSPQSAGLAKPRPALRRRPILQKALLGCVFSIAEQCTPRAEREEYTVRRRTVPAPPRPLFPATVPAKA